MDKQTLQEALNKAIEMEEKGFKFYKEAGRTCKNEITRRTFGFLADNEILHIEIIKNFYDTLREKGGLPSLELGDTRHRRAEALTIFSKSISELKDKVRQSDDDKKACEFAMEFENTGYRYYKDMLDKAKDKNLIEFLRFLIEEEGKHYEGIGALYAYITDSQNWFMYEEGSFPQG